MGRTVPLALAAAGLLALAAPSAFAAHGFHYGVTAAEVTSKSAVVWARPDKAGKYTAQVATNKRFTSGVKSRKVTATTRRDLTVQTRFRGLKPNRIYYYRFKAGKKVSDVGRFHTAPSPNANATVKFAWSGDEDAQPAPGSKKPFFGPMKAFGAMAKQKNLFSINLGDTIYSDSEVKGESTLATTVRQKWAKYKMNLATKNYQRIREASGMYNEWDDHEFQNDFSKPEFGNTIYQAGVKAFRNYMPVSYHSATGLYRSFRWGKNVELFFLDERSFRSAKASANHVCDNPSTGQPDNAPTAPQTTRSLFSALDPEFLQPVSPACLNAINDPSRTFLGHAQLALLERALQHSSATWKVLVNEVPIQQFYALPYDRWEGYAAERTKLLTFLTQKVKNAVFLTTDVHANLVNDVRFQTLEAGGPKNSGIEEFTTGPVGTGTFSQEIDNTIGKPGSGAAVTSAFFKPPPPNGVGMQCANTNTFSFGQVTATAKKFTVKLLDQNGKPIKDVGNKPCGPFTLKKK
ncbi:MAG TPA: alkaline phosphatase D family protein [Thermoleophilaceae bacterium]